MKEYLLEDTSTNATEVYAKIKNIDLVLEEGTPEEKAAILHEFYHTEIPKGMDMIEKQIQIEETLLIEDFANFLD